MLERIKEHFAINYMYTSKGFTIVWFESQKSKMIKAILTIKIIAHNIIKKNWYIKGDSK